MALDAAIALVSLASAKAALGITASSEDDNIERLIDRMSAFAGSYCGRKFISASYTKEYDGHDDTILLLDQYPVTAVTSVKIDSSREFEAASLVDADDYDLDVDAGLIKLVGIGQTLFPKGLGNIQVVYTAGYATNAVPHDLQHAVLLMVTATYKKDFQQKRSGISSETVGDKTVTYESEAIPKAAMKILDQYRIANTATHGA
jgi:uncharacterized phiE125 gp8 family phage protein